MEYITLIKSPPLGLLTLEMVHATSNQIKRKVLSFIPLDEAPSSEDPRSKLALQVPLLLLHEHTKALLAPKHSHSI